MDKEMFALILQVLFVGLWFAPLIIPYWILKHWADERKANGSSGNRTVIRKRRLSPTES